MISFGLTQAVIQLLTAASGILLVRMLSKSEYSYYTIANSVQGFLNNLTDIGIGTGLLAIGGRIFMFPQKLGSLLQTGLSERRRLAWPLSLIAIAILTFLLLKAGSHPVQILLLSLLVILSFYFQYQTTVFGVALRLHEQIYNLQVLEVGTSAIRLALTASLLLFFPSASLGLAAVVLVVALQFYFHRRWTMKIADLTQCPSAEQAKQLRLIMRAMAPNVLFQSIQGQIPIFLLTVMGQSGSVAEFGAISRLAMLFAIFGAINTSILHPGFARLKDPAHLIRKFWEIVGLNTLVGFGLVLVSIAFPGPLLWILGSKYGNLDKELVLAVIGAALSLFSGGVWGMAAARGWVSKSWLYIPATILGQIISIMFFDLGTVRGILMLNVICQCLAISAFLFIVYQGFSNQRSSADPEL